MKKLSILALFSLLLILSISFASAEDVNADDMAIDESSGQKEVSVEETHEDLKAGNTIYISPSGTGTGSSESDPTNWNDALSKASSGGVIEFSNGTYYDVKNIYVNNVELKGAETLSSTQVGMADSSQPMET